VLVGWASIVVRSSSSQVRSHLLQQPNRVLVAVVVQVEVSQEACPALWDSEEAQVELEVQVERTLMMLTLLHLGHQAEVTPVVHPVLVVVIKKQAKKKAVRWCLRRLQEEWFVARVDFAQAMERATPHLPHVDANQCTSETSASSNIAPVSSKLARTAMGMVSVRWVNANVLQATVWRLFECWGPNHCPRHVWTRSVQLAVACMGSASRASAFASKVGKDPTVRIPSAPMTALAMASAPFSPSIALASASATMGGVAPDVSGWRSTHSSRNARTTAQGMDCAWMAFVHATLVSKVRIAVT